MASAPIASLQRRLLERAERRLPALTRHRRAEPLPIRLHSRRVYILPTRFGLVFAVVGFAMMLGALNFNNNPAMMLSFLVGSVAVLSFHHTVAQLRGLALVALRAGRVHAGEAALVQFGIRESEARERPALMLEQDGQEISFAAAADQTTTVTVRIATRRRGWQGVGLWRLWSEYPFGIVWAWSYLHPEERFLVFPLPEAGAPPLPGEARDDPGTQYRTPGDDWIGLRDLRAGDPPRRVAWRASARSERWLVKEFADPVAKAVVLDYAELGALDHERRISRLTRWVLIAERRQLSFRLRLPGVDLGPATGPDHVLACLRELALLP
jgi:uncharacterized protein (DUF58 family)